jgi:hypothetical protein
MSNSDDTNRICRTVMLIEGLTEEAQIEREVRWEKRLAAHVADKYKPRPKSRAEVKRTKLFELRKKTNEIRCELDLNNELEKEAKRTEEVNLALYRSDMTPEQKRQREEDTRIMSLWAGTICKEASADGREQARLEFSQKKLS